MAKRKRSIVRKQPQNIISDEIIIPNHSGMLDAGKIHRTPTDDLDPANKKYVDDNAGGTPEGTAIKSTGEGGGTKYLREDGDNTCSWQTPAGSGDVTAAVNLTDETIVQGDGGAKGVKTSTATVGQVATNVTHVAGDGSDHADVATNTIHISSDGTNHANVVLNDTHRGLTNEHLDWTADLGATNIHAGNYTDTNTTYTGGTNLTLVGTEFNVDDAFLKNSAADVGVGLTLTGDNSVADTAYVPMVLYNTDSTPPAANGFPVGTIYIQYTA